MKNCEAYFDYEKKWNDSVSLLIYPSEYARQNECVVASSLNASKKTILNNISKITEDLENDIVYLIDNICELTKVELLIKERTFMTIGISKISFYASKQFFDIIKKTIEDTSGFIDSRFKNEI